MDIRNLISSKKGDRPKPPCFEIFGLVALNWTSELSVPMSPRNKFFRLQAMAALSCGRMIVSPPAYADSGRSEFAQFS